MKKFSKYYFIGGVPYHRTAVLSGHPISIYSANDESLYVETHDGPRLIDADNADLVLYEKGEMIPAYRYPELKG